MFWFCSWVFTVNITLSLMHNDVPSVRLMMIAWCLMQAVTNEDVTQEELGGAKTHTSMSGADKFVLFVWPELISQLHDFWSVLNNETLLLDSLKVTVAEWAPGRLVEVRVFSVWKVCTVDMVLWTEGNSGDKWYFSMQSDCTFRCSSWCLQQRHWSSSWSSWTGQLLASEQPWTCANTQVWRPLVSFV